MKDTQQINNVSILTSKMVFLFEHGLIIHK